MIADEVAFVVERLAVIVLVFVGVDPWSVSWHDFVQAGDWVCLTCSLQYASSGGGAIRRFSCDFVQPLCYSPLIVQLYVLECAV